MGILRRCRFKNDGNESTDIVIYSSQVGSSPTAEKRLYLLTRIVFTRRWIAITVRLKQFSKAQGMKAIKQQSVWRGASYKDRPILFIVWSL